MEGKKYIIVIDMQNDFLKLKEDDTLAKNINKFLKNHEDYTVIFTKDIHDKDEDSVEHDLLFSHCIRGTKGSEINRYLKRKSKSSLIVNKSTFGSLTLSSYLDTHNTSEIILTGVCTDICVISNALFLRANFPKAKIIVKKDLVKGTTEERHNAALEVMKSCLIEVN